MIKYFISTGCSFTEIPMQEFHDKTYVDIDQYPKFTFSWPLHLNNYLKTIPCYKGKGASGNGIISRATIFEVLKALQTYKPEDILVGIMWSGAYRQEVYSTNIQFEYHKITKGNVNTDNPASVGGLSNFYKVMPYWEDELSKMYYKNIYDDIGAYIQTVENILRVQWFLKQNKIKYFMSQYYYPTFPDSEEIKNHPDYKYLHDAIDFNEWLDVESEFDWCCKFQDPRTWDNLPISDPNAEFVFKHPNTIQHKAFTEQVIIPHLQKKGYI
jgi:hypothetical protein